MIINIAKSDLFVTDPDKRFAREYGLPHGMWNLMYNRGRYLEYSVNELCELFQVKTKKQISYQSMRRWLWRTEIYKIALPAIQKGAQSVVSEMFGEYEEELLRELTKHIKDGVTKDSTILI